MIIPLYRDMTATSLLQRRATTNNGSTYWRNSVLLLLAAHAHFFTMPCPGAVTQALLRAALEGKVLCSCVQPPSTDLLHACTPTCYIPSQGGCAGWR